MKMWMFLTWVLGMVSFGTFVWLTVVAFKQRMLWGFLVLFLSPITAVIFALKYWQESKKPFLWHTGSTVGCIVAFVMLFAQMGGFQMISMAHQISQGEITEAEAMGLMEEQMERMENSGLLSEKDQQELQQMRQAFQDMRNEQGEDPPSLDADVAEWTPPSSAPATEISALERIPSRTPSAKDPSILDEPILESEFQGYEPVKFDEAPDHVGELVRAIARDGREYRGMLTRASDGMLFLERDMTAGTATFEVAVSEIESLHVLAR